MAQVDEIIRRCSAFLNEVSEQKVPIPQEKIQETLAGLETMLANPMIADHLAAVSDDELEVFFNQMLAAL